MPRKLLTGKIIEDYTIEGAWERVRAELPRHRDKILKLRVKRDTAATGSNTYRKTIASCASRYVALKDRRKVLLEHAKTLRRLRRERDRSIYEAINRLNQE